LQLKNIRWKRWGAGLIGGMALYSMAGFWLVPHLIKSRLPLFAQNTLERRATLADVHFNPYTLRLEAADFRLTEADGAPLFGVGKLVVELDWRSLVKRAWTLAEIRITAPTVSLAIAPDGRFNIAALLAMFNRTPDDKSSGMPRLIIRHFALEQGRIDMNDRRAGYTDTYAPINFALNNLSTLPDEHGDYTFSADAEHGGKLAWKGAATLNPIAGSGVLTLSNVALPGLTGYLKSYAHLMVVDGKLSATLPYRFGDDGGHVDASLNGAGLTLRDLALVRTGDNDAFAKLQQLVISDVNFDLVRHTVSVGAVRLADGSVAIHRDASGAIDLATLMVTAPPSGATPPAKVPPSAPSANWKVNVRQVAIDRLAVSATDDTVRPALKLSAEQLQLSLKLDAQQAATGTAVTVTDAAFSLQGLSMASGQRVPFKLAHIGFDDGNIDLAAHHASVGRVFADGAAIDLARDASGQFTLLRSLPKFSAGPKNDAIPAPAATQPVPWTGQIGSIELNKFGAHIHDASTGITSTVQDFHLKVDGASTDLHRPVDFNTGLGLREGGELSAHGKLVPASGAVDAELLVKRLALAPVQPLLSHYVKLKLAGGSINAQGRIQTGAGGAKNPALRYAGSFEVAGLVLNEDNGDLFGSWKSVRADKLKLGIQPNLLDIPELRIVEPNAKLIIQNDRSLNATRLLVRPPAPAPMVASAPAASAPVAPAPAAAPVVASAAPASDSGFPVRVRRLRVQNGKLDFADLSLRPQFGAKIYELNGVITGLSTKGDARSQIELDGRVDDFGLARVRGELNPFVPADNTDLNVVFNNVDLVSASPYSMKFAGYKIAEGKISLDLQYKIRDHQLEGQNHIVLDNLTLGEAIDSPDALKLPLQLALAILKDSDGRIDLGLPVSGNMNDPQFSYGAVVWKAIGNVLSKIVTAPFRALGNLLGMSSDDVGTIDFDPGSAVLLPPEREKLNNVAKMLAKRPQLQLAVPGQYSDEADGAALRTRAVRRAVATRAGMTLAPGEEPGPFSISERKVRTALRDLYGERFGAAALDKEKVAAEAAGAPAKTAAPGKDAATQKLPIWQRLGKLVQGEPQVADPTAFYTALQQRLEKSEPLAPDALVRLGQQRSNAVLAALAGGATPAASVHGAPPEKISAPAGKPVPLRLQLASH